MVHEVLSKAPSISKAPNTTTFFFSVLILNVQVHSTEQFQWTSLVGKQIGIKVEDAPQRSGP